MCGSDVLAEDNFCRTCGAQLVRPETKAMPKFQDSDRRESIGIFLVTMGALVGVLSYLIGIVPMLALGLASFLIGIMALYLPEREGDIAGRLATDSSLPALINIENLLEELDLDERGIYIPTSGLGVSPKVFVPLAVTAATKQPPIGLVSSRRIFVTVGKNPEDRGVLLDAPGSEILAALETSMHIDLAGTKLEDLGAVLDSGLKALTIAKVMNYERQDTSINIRLELISLVELERKLRNVAPRLVVQIGTPAASAVASAVSKATGKYVTFKSAILDPSGRKLSITLKLGT
jgi:hypothetical protein